MEVFPIEWTGHTGCGDIFPASHLSAHASGFCTYDKDSATEARHKAHRKATTAHEILLIYLVGGFIHWESLNLDIKEAIYYIADAIALAEVYDILPKIAQNLARDIKHTPGLWNDIATHATSYIALGIKLRDTLLFTKALRQLAAKYHKPQDGRIAQQSKPQGKGSERAYYQVTHEVPWDSAEPWKEELGYRRVDAEWMNLVREAFVKD